MNWKYLNSQFFCFFLIYFFKFYFIFKLYNIVLVLPNIEMNPPQVYTCSPSWNPLPSPSPYHPSGSSQCTSPKHPASCIEPGLVTHFIHDSIHVSMPFSQIFPASPSHRVHKTVLYISVSFAISNFTFYLQLKPAQLLFNSSRNFQSKSYFSTTLSKTIV